MTDADLDSLGALATRGAPLTPRTILALIADIRGLRTMLRDVEWAGRIYYDVGCCHFCDGIAPHESDRLGTRGHQPGCAWVAAVGGITVPVVATD